MTSGRRPTQDHQPYSGDPVGESVVGYSVGPNVVGDPLVGALVVGALVVAQSHLLVHSLLQSLLVHKSSRA